MDPITVALILACMALLYMYLTRNHNYWKSRNVPYITPLSVLGNIKPLLMLELAPGPFLEKFYNYPQAKNQRYFGFFNFNCQPALLIRDPELVKRILIQDFNHFHNRSVLRNSCDRLGSNNLFSLHDSKWKWIRGKLSPTFTTGKLKQMFLLIQDIGMNLEKIMDESISSTQSKEEGAVLEFKELISRYTTDVITKCAYGLEVNSLTDPNSSFRHFGRKVFQTTGYRCMETRSHFFMHDLAKLFRFYFFDKESSNFMREVFTQAITLREKEPCSRNDFIDMLIKMKQDHEAGLEEANSKEFDLSHDDIVAQAAVFYTAGFETTASTIMYTMYELALQPEIQEKVRKEIISTLEEEGESSLTYEALSKMKYLDMIVSETLRKYPSLPFLDRLCMEDYRVPDSDLVIKKGIPVYISLMGLHYDPKYFPDPEKFDPERFSNENKANIHSGTYLPFGDGPHICIGARFGVMSSKLAIANILKKYSVKPSKETQVPLEFSMKALLMSPKGGMYFKFALA